MSFDVTADAYLRFMGRWSEPLTREFLESADVRVTGQVVDVGCGPGVLTAVLVDRYGAPAVAAIDPSASFVAATRERFPGMDVRQGTAEALPYDDGDLRRGAGPAGRALHDRPGGGAARHGPGDQGGRGGRGVCLGPRRGRLTAVPVLVRCPGRGPGRPERGRAAGDQGRPARGVRTRGRPARHHVLGPHRDRPLRVLRRVVGALPLRRGPARCLRRDAGGRPPPHA